MNAITQTERHQVVTVSKPSVTEVAREIYMSTLGQRASKRAELEQRYNALLVQIDQRLRPLYAIEEEARATWWRIYRSVVRRRLLRHLFTRSFWESLFWASVPYWFYSCALSTERWFGWTPTWALWVFWPAVVLSAIVLAVDILVKVPDEDEDERQARIWKLASYWPMWLAGLIALKVPGVAGACFRIGFLAWGVLHLVPVWRKVFQKPRTFYDPYINAYYVSEANNVPVKIFDVRQFREVDAMSISGRVATSIFQGKNVPVPDYELMFSRGYLQPGDVVLSFGGELGREIVSWSPERGIYVNKTVVEEEIPQLRGRWRAIERKLNRAKFLALIEGAKRVAPLVLMSEVYRYHLERAVEEEKAIEEAASIWDGYFIDPDVLRKVIANIILFQRGDPAAPEGLLLEGPPGTGKTELARRIARAAGAHFIATSKDELKGEHVGSTEANVRKLFEEARAHAPAIIFVDECDGAFPNRRDPRADQFAIAITEGFLANWQGFKEGAKIWVIGATNYPQAIDPAIMRRFGERITIPLPGEEERRASLQAAFRKMDIGLQVTDALVEATTGMSHDDLQKVAKFARREALSDGGVVEEHHVQAAIATIRGRSSTAVIEDARWDTLVVADETREELMTICEMLKHASTLTRQNISLPKGMLLYGPPGTGKTQIARTLANESGLTFIALKASDLEGEYQGHTAPKVEAAFAQARQRSPCIVFMDEVDALAPRDRQPSSYKDDLVNALKRELDGIERHDGVVFLLAATNHPERIDEAVLRRLPERVYVPLPNESQRRQLLKIYLRNKPVEQETLDDIITIIAARTEGLSGSALKDLVARAERRATRKALQAGRPDRVMVELEDLLEAIPS